MPTDRRYTGQREDMYTQLYYMGARWYDAELSRWTSPDTIVPDPGNPQSLNRYSYVYGNPLGYRDPDGHNPLPYLAVLAGSYLVGRLTYDAVSAVFPSLDRSRRDCVVGAMVTNMADTIRSEAAAHSVSSALVGAVLRHESAAVERRALSLWPTIPPGLLANAGESAQYALQGELASIGPGQMQMATARRLEEIGYVTPRGSANQRRNALLGRDTSVEYVAGMLQYMTNQLSTLDGFNDLDVEAQNRLILIGYNWGWTDEFQNALLNYGLTGMIDEMAYDNETLDEYLRWSTEQ